MKTITIVVPTYNEEANVTSVYTRVRSLFESRLSGYLMELLFIDNGSTDNTRDLIADIAGKDGRVQAIFNSANFGFNRSTFYGVSQAEGDCAVLMYADMQDPPEVIPQMVEKWEQGCQIVVGIKNGCDENFFIRNCRKSYYHLLSKISDTDHIEQYDGFGLYDRVFIEQIRKLSDPIPYLRGIVAEFGYKRGEVKYDQQKRERGKSSFNFMKLYDVAMLGITSSSKAVMRMASFIGVGLGIICIVIAVVTFVIKLLNWNYFSAGTAAVLVGIFFVGAVQIFFLGFLGEYVLNINIRSMHHPVVVEARRINMKRDPQNIAEDNKAVDGRSEN